MRSLVLSMLAMMALPSAVHAAGLPCSAALLPSVPDALVLSISAMERHDHSIRVSDGGIAPEFCDVNITLTHPGENDKVGVQIMLPLNNWNGRFQGIGGGGYAARYGEYALADAITRGYAAAQTDAGVTQEMLSAEAWALDSENRVNWSLLTNFAFRSVHDLAVVGKEITALFYGKKPKYSYWSGCSTGGRQGYMEAQRYPEDFDGILAVAPAINWDRFLPAEQWGQVVMAQEKVFPTPCEYSAFINASIAACDALDGVTDGVIADQAGCNFDPFSLVGTSATCDGASSTITRPMAALIEKIHQGPRTKDGKFLWYGLAWGTPYSFIADTHEVNGKRAGRSFPISENWVRLFLKQDPKFDVSSMTYNEFESTFAHSVAQFNEIMGSDNPDLSAFFKHGGKLLTWHGLADAGIFPEGTIDYYNRVKDTVGASHIDDFYRVFMTPGVGHCAGGNGPVPVDLLSELVDWVEGDKAPDTIFAQTAGTDGTIISRNICRHPLVSTYTGHGDPNFAQNYVCASSFKAQDVPKETKDEL